MPLKIYYLDDEPELCENAVDLLSSAEMEVEGFSDVDSFIKKVKMNTPDILILDYRLPGITGDLVAQQLDPSIPKILVTGDMQVKTTYNFFAVLEKPVKEFQLVEVIKKIGKA